MIIRKVLPEERESYNNVVTHPLQSWEWGEFKESVGWRAVRLGVFEEEKMISGFQVLFKNLGKTPYSVGQLLKSFLPTEEIISALKDLAKEEKAIFIKSEPDFVAKTWQNIKGEIIEPSVEEKVNMESLGLTRAAKPLFDPFSFVLDLTKSEGEMLTNMHPKTRYNIRLAEKNGVEVAENSSEEGLEIFLRLFFETQKRQKFYMHTPDYFRKLWEVFGRKGIAKIFIAKYKEKVLNAWMLFVWRDRIFYPYGASANEMRNLMASNLICWEAIKFGKKLGCKSFDMWGCLGPKPDEMHPWFGFHRFKLGYGGNLVEFCGSWDLVNEPLLYKAFNVVDNFRWKILRMRKKMGF